MNMWGLLMIILAVLSAAGILYLASRIGRFWIIKRIAKEKRNICFLIGLIILIALSASIWLAWGYMNAIVCILHLLVFWLLAEGIFTIIQKIRKKEFKRYYAGITAVVFTVCYLGAGWYCAHHVWQTSYEIHTDKSVGNLKVAVFSDSHVGATFDGEGFAGHMKEIEAQSPDIILIVGDFVDDDTSKADMVRACRALGELKCTYGV